MKHFWQDKFLAISRLRNRYYGDLDPFSAHRSPHPSTHHLAYQNTNSMKPLSLLLPISVLALCPTSAQAGKPVESTVPNNDPTPGNSKKVTAVDFHDNNGWGNGDQDAPGNSSDHNNAENGPRSSPGNENGKPAKGETDDVTQQELDRIEREALERSAEASVNAQADKVVARRVK